MADISKEELCIIVSSLRIMSENAPREKSKLKSQVELLLGNLEKELKKISNP
jgi:hypothetical protein